LCDEVVICHVDEDTERRIDQRAYRCCVVSKDPLKIPQTVFLAMAHHEPNPRRGSQIHMVRPRAALNCNVFKILIHIDAIEDLMFYHYPREELLADGKIPWRDFSWQYGRADGDLEEEDLHPVTKACGQTPLRRPRDDDDQDRGQQDPHQGASSADF
jgi:hypothetical protein